MTIEEIYQAFDKIACLSFTTVDEDSRPESRIAHLRGYDENGMYFMTMHTNTFYQHLKNNPYISLCGLCADTKVSHDENGMPTFEGGYSIRMTGKVKEIPIEEIKAKCSFLAIKEEGNKYSKAAPLLRRTFLFLNGRNCLKIPLRLGIRLVD